MKKIVLGALFLSILHSILFYGQDFGISVVLFVIPMLLLIIYSLQSKNKVKNAKAFILSIPITLLSLTYALYNNGVLNIINMIAIIVLTTTMITWAIYDEFNFKNAFCKVFSIIFKPFGSIAEGVRVISNNLFRRKENKIQTNKNPIKESKVMKQIIIGLVISLPLLIIILALLISADTVFAEILKPIKYVIMNIFNIKFLSSIYFRAIFIILVFMYIVAFICSMLKIDPNKKKSASKGINMQNITVNTVLTVLNVVYLLFSIVQFVYLFANLGIVENFDYATYARRGFFQLMFVTLINFVIIIITSLNKRETTKGINIYTKIMNMLLIVFTVVMILSSFLRMYLYEQEYGYTFLRLLVYFILVTELILAIPTFVYVFNKKISLLKYYIVIISVMLVILNFTNVDKTIARRNVDKYISETSLKDEKAEIDIKYLKKLSIDAVPEIVRLYQNTSDTSLKNNIELYLTYNSKIRSRNNKKIQDLFEDKNFQELNLSKYKAKKAIKSLNLYGNKNI